MWYRLKLKRKSGATEALPERAGNPPAWGEVIEINLNGGVVTARVEGIQHEMPQNRYGARYHAVACVLLHEV